MFYNYYQFECTLKIIHKHIHRKKRNTQFHCKVISPCKNPLGKKQNHVKKITTVKDITTANCRHVETVSFMHVFAVFDLNT